MQRQMSTRGSLSLACALTFVLPSIAAEEEYKSCFGNPGFSGKIGSDLGETLSCIILREREGEYSSLLCGLGSQGTEKCCVALYSNRKEADGLRTSEAIQVWNDLQIKGDVDDLDSDADSDSKCFENVESGSSSVCGEPCVYAVRSTYKLGADGNPDLTSPDSTYCTGNVKVTRESNGHLSGFECSKNVEVDTETGEVRPGEGRDNEDDSESSQCFPGGATVQLQGGAVKNMSDLVIGDVVQVSATEYSPVFMFTHKLAHVVNSFVELRTASGHRLPATPGHFVYINGALAPAHTIRVGDLVTVDSGGHSEVIEVSRAKHAGLYNPQTIHGDLVVNGVLSSTYTTAVEPVVAHSILAPLRGAYRLFDAFMRAYDHCHVMRLQVATFLEHQQYKLR